MEFTNVFEKVPEGYIAFVEELPLAQRICKDLEVLRL